MALGDPVTVLSGPFMGFKGKLVREAGDKFIVALNVFGRTTEVSLTRADIGLPGATLDVLEGEVLEAVARRGYRHRLFHFWQEQSQRTPIPSEPELLALYEKEAAQIEGEQQVAQSEALAKFRAGFEGLDVEARNVKWLSENEAWAGWREQAKVVTAALDAPRLGHLAEEERSREARRLRDAGHALRTQIEGFRRRQLLNGAPVAEARNEALEQAIDRDLESDAPFLVYSDWLLSKANPRGELIALQAAGIERKTAAASLRERLALQLLGGLAGYEDRLAAKWRLGFLESVTIEATRADEAENVDVVKLLEILFQLASARFLRTLRVKCPSVHEEQLTPRMHAAFVAAGPRPSLRSLALVTNEEEEMLSWTSAGELSRLSAVFPNLESLEVHAGGYGLTAPKFPQLKSLVLQTCHLSTDNLAAIIAADWPALERLELWFGSASYGVEIPLEQVAPLLSSPRLPRLKSLALNNCELTDALCVAVLGSPLLPQLESLSLSMGTMTEAGARTLIDGAEKLEHLKTLDVNDNYLTSDMVDELRSVLPQTKSEEQRTAELYEGKLLRYASVGE